jgi:REP element-mobilizing transposase RayT
MQRASKRGRKRHVQQQLFRHGGKRKRAGRKPKGARAGSPHKKRPTIKASQALHVVLRIDPSVGNLRCRKLYKALRDATITAALRERFRIVHVSIQTNHVHLLAEAANNQALARGMQGFQISAARHINTALGRSLPPPARPGLHRPLSRRSDHVSDSRAARLVLRL